MGGLSKKAFQFQKLAADAALPHLALDAGNLLFKHGTIAPGQELEEKMTAATIIKAYNLIGYQAVCVGSQDLIAGLPYLQKLKGDAKFAWLSANLVHTSSHQPFFKESATFKIGSIKVGVIGLTGPATLPASDDATILPWDQVLPSLAAQVAKKNELVILLSNLPAADNQRIAEAYATIHLIIASGAMANTISADPINNTVVTSTGAQGKQIGIMNINWQTGKRWGTQTAAILATKKSSLDRLLWQLGKYPQGKDPEASLRDQPDRLKTYRILKTRQQELRTEIDQLSKEIGNQGQAKSEPSSYTNRFMVMEANLPDQSEIARLVDQLDKAIFTLGRQGHAKISSPAGKK
jgi:2',3'-cyclic-nucleotide 2'-phosphodiesterase (5'-nucleotidase family)